MIDIKSKFGKLILKNYIKLIGGKFVGEGSSKCVFSPAIKCLGENKRYGDDIKGDSSNNYISAIGDRVYLEEDIVQDQKLLPKIDPKGEFTLRIKKICKLGHFDEKDESEKELRRCSVSNVYRIIRWDVGFNNHQKRLNTDIYDKKDALKDSKLVNLIMPKGGKDLSKIIEDVKRNKKNIFQKKI